MVQNKKNSESDKHKARVIEATKDFISSKLGRGKKPERGSKVKTERKLW